LRVLADRPRKPAQFLVLGSASPELLRQTSETLAGRIAYHELGGFQLDELGAPNLSRLWLRGGFPRSYLAPSNARLLHGVTRSSAPSCSATSLNSASGPRLPHFGASGAWSRTTTARSGTHRS